MKISKNMKRVLITGANSYIGDSVKDYLAQYPDEYSVSIKDTVGWEPEVAVFKGYDVVFHVAGIAHIKETKSTAHLYYEVNRDLAIKVAETAKTSGVKHFIIMSSMSVYGMTTGFIDKQTKPNPKSHYGKSKLEADEAIAKMADDHFKVAILRPPMVYGKDCKGNYQKLRWLALHTPVFPYVENQRSMLYIGNLCWFVKKCIDEEKAGLFFPQNAEYVNTSEMVRMVALTNGRKVGFTKIFNPIFGFLRMLSCKSVEKVCGSLVYENVDIVGAYDFLDTIALTENELV